MVLNMVYKVILVQNEGILKTKQNNYLLSEWNIRPKEYSLKDKEQTIEFKQTNKQTKVPRNYLWYGEKNPH